MRFGIFGDVHGNIEALQAVLDALEGDTVDALVCTGDIVGYGASPAECVREIRKRDILTVAGNHDHAVVEKTSIEYFNPDARDGVLWTRQALPAAEQEFLAGLPLLARNDHLLLVHSTPCVPERFDYIATLEDAWVAFRSMSENGDTRCFVGHSHVPLTFFGTEPLSYALDTEMEVALESTVIVNVGSVGQPRDLHWEACYCIYDTDCETVWIRRVPYDVDAAIEKILDAGLPVMNAERIRYGR